ncbi:MAG: hypothetical protein ACJ8G7_05560 [Rhizobacter sp.]
MKTWVRDVLGEVPTSFEAPGAARPPGRSIGLYLLDLAPAASTRGDTRPPLQFRVRYLVTAWGDDASATHDDLCELAFAAMETPEFEVDVEPLGLAAWSAFGTPPRPSFSVRLALRKERPRLAAPWVRAPLVLAPSAMLPLHGVVLGPGDVGLAGARVELRTLGLVSLTDHEGRFRFAGAPADRALRLRVQARGKTQEFQSEGAGTPERPLHLRMEFP